MTTYPQTPDGRYFLVRGRLWRCTNPNLSQQEIQMFTQALMGGRRAVRAALAANDPDAVAAARAQVHAAKCALGERGRVWWNDGAPDHNRKMAKNTPYKDWYEALMPPPFNNVLN